jgi:hypothetical protein
MPVEVAAARSLLSANRSLPHVACKAQAAQFAANVLPIIREIQAAGHTSFNAIAGQLNARKIATANGRRCSPS